jgi:hypothetical protein
MKNLRIKRGTHAKSFRKVCKEKQRGKVVGMVS